MISVQSYCFVDFSSFFRFSFADSIIYSNSTQGLNTIQAFDARARLQTRLFQLLDANTQSVGAFFEANRWFAIRVEFFAIVSYHAPEILNLEE
jgi:hypothetical protein